MVYQDTNFKICLSLFGWKENILYKVHIVQCSACVRLTGPDEVLRWHNSVFRLSPGKARVAVEQCGTPTFIAGQRFCRHKILFVLTFNKWGHFSSWGGVLTTPGNRPRQAHPNLWSATLGRVVGSAPVHLGSRALPPGVAVSSLERARRDVPVRLASQSRHSIHNHQWGFSIRISRLKNIKSIFFDIYE